MRERLPQVYLARHGETAWTISGQHTGLTDLPLTQRGEENARRLGERFKGLSFAGVFTSPLQRAHRTCELTGFRASVEVDPDLVEWDYGRYEGLTTADIHKERPDWELFRDGCPGGESLTAVSARADRVIGRLRAARWLGARADLGRHLFLGTAALSVLGYEHNTSEPVVRLWNDISHATA